MVWRAANGTNEATWNGVLVQSPRCARAGGESRGGDTERAHDAVTRARARMLTQAPTNTYLQYGKLPGAVCSRFLRSTGGEVAGSYHAARYFAAEHQLRSTRR